MPPRPVIEMSRISMTYKGHVTALQDVTLRIDRGEFVFLVGPTGSGKSTILKMLYRDVLPTSGSLIVAGRDFSRMSPNEVPLLRRQMGIVFQDYGLLPDRNVWENIAFVCRVLGLSRREIRRRLPETLDLVGLTHRCDAFPHELSGGEQQRVAIARAIINNPALLIADEPTGNLDPDTSRGIMEVLLEANRRGATVLIATHDRAAVNRLRRRVIAIEQGAIVRDDVEGAYGHYD